MQAAFFDLDKTVISRSSIMALAGTFRREGMLRRRSLARGACTQLLYLRWGAGPERLAKIQKAVLAVTAGWEQAGVRRLVDGQLAPSIDPITYRGAVDLISAHRAAGRRVVLVSAAPEDLVEPIGAHLGVDEVIASRPLVDGDGRYTGELDRYAYGPTKASLVQELARREGIDLERSWAYSDSATDLPMLEVVGNPVAVNPDRALRRVATMRGWEVARFDVQGPEVSRPVPVPRRRRLALPASAAAAVLATTGGFTAWWVLRCPDRLS